MNDAALSTDPRLPGDTTEWDIHRRFGSHTDAIERNAPCAADILDRILNEADARPSKTPIADLIEQWMSESHPLHKVWERARSIVLDEMIAEIVNDYELQSTGDGPDCVCGSAKEFARRLVKAAKIVAAPMIPPTLGTITGTAMAGGHEDIEDPFDGEPGSVQARRDV